MGLFATFGNPLLDLLMHYMYTKAKRGTAVFAFLDKLIHPLLHNVTVESAANDPPYTIHKPYLDANYLLVTVISYLGLLLTFGTLFPPIAVVMLVSIVSKVFVTRLKVGRFLHSAAALGIYKYGDIIHHECRGVGSIPKLRRCMRQLVVCCCWFYAPFLFDTLSDAVGVRRSICVLVVVPFVPIVMFVSHMTYTARMESKQCIIGQSTTTGDIELRPVGPGASEAATAGGDERSCIPAQKREYKTHVVTYNALL